MFFIQVMMNHSETMELSYMVSMKQMVAGRLKICGGTVLTTTLTLTAAHCLVDGITGLKLFFGSIYLFHGIFLEAKTIVLHKDFDPCTLTHDIGLVSVFPSRVTFGYKVQPVKLPDHNLNLKTNSLVTIYGWGAISERKPFSEVLQSADLPVVTDSICRVLLNDIIPDNTFCLGYLDGRADACRGDSGGPAMLDDVQIGIISFGEGCAQPFNPGVYTDVRKYLNWIYNAIALIP